MSSKIFTKISQEEIFKLKPTVAEVRRLKRTPIYGLLENVRSLHNVGAMFRSSDAALVAELYICGLTGTPPHRDIDKSALGASDVVPWRYIRRGLDAASELKERGVRLIALELTHQSISYSEQHYSFPACLIVGNEIDGISDELLMACDYAVNIPMLGRANSLNVATAYGVALFEMLRQYHSS